jgi:type II secretory pathway predicted ATPase ExeA
MLSGNTVTHLIEPVEMPLPVAATSLTYYGLKEQPFGSTPDPRFLYFTASHSEALSAVLFGIESGRGFATLIAPPGMGKTTLLFRLLERYKSSARTAFLFQTQCNSREFLSSLLTDLGSEPGRRSMAQMHEMLGELLAREAAAGRRVVVFIDEAHNLDSPVLETVRLLSDFERPNAKLIDIVLAGQPTLADKLSAPALRQRTSVRARLGPLTATEVPNYIEHRLRVAGFTGDPLFTPEAESLLAERSEGIPRNINNLCFHALITGSALLRKPIDADIVLEVLADLEAQDIRPEFESTPAKVQRPELTAKGSLEMPSPTRGDAADAVGEIFAGISASDGIDSWIQGAPRQASRTVKGKVDTERDDVFSSVAADARKGSQSELAAAQEPSSQDPGAGLSILKAEHPPWATSRSHAQTPEKDRKVISDLQTALKRHADETAERLNEKRHVARVIEGVDRHLAGLSSASRESLTKEIKGIADECRNQLRQQVNAVVLEGKQQLQTEYEKVRTRYESTQRPVDAYRASPASSMTQPDSRDARSAPRKETLIAALRIGVWFFPLLFVALSIHPVTYLPSDPPAEFVGPGEDGSSPMSPSEERSALAYWQSAIQDVQPKYELGTDLPEEPPAEFRTGGNTAQHGTPRSDTRTRRRYWRRLRQIWVQPQFWKKSYWDTGWLDTMLKSMRQEFQEIISEIK